MKIILMILLIIGLSGQSSNVIAEFEYYDDPPPRMPSQVTFYGTGRCDLDDLVVMQRAFDTWGVIEVDIDLSVTVVESFKGYILDCQPTFFDLVELTPILPSGIKRMENRTAVARSVIHWFGPTGQMVGCTITLFQDRISDEILYPVFLHEDGHCLGLPHGSSNSMMFENLLFDELQIEDMARVSILYGNCDSVIFDKLDNAFIPSGRLYNSNVLLMGFINAGDIWPYDGYGIETAECIRPR